MNLNLFTFTEKVNKLLTKQKTASANCYIHNIIPQKHTQQNKLVMYQQGRP